MNTNLFKPLTFIGELKLKDFIQFDVAHHVAWRGIKFRCDSIFFRPKTKTTSRDESVHKLASSHTVFPWPLDKKMGKESYV